MHSLLLLQRRLCLGVPVAADQLSRIVGIDVAPILDNVSIEFQRVAVQFAEIKTMRNLMIGGPIDRNVLALRATVRVNELLLRSHLKSQVVQPRRTPVAGGDLDMAILADPVAGRDLHKPEIMVGVSVAHEDHRDPGLTKHFLKTTNVAVELTGLLIVGHEQIEMAETLRSDFDARAVFHILPPSSAFSWFESY